MLLAKSVVLRVLLLCCGLLLGVEARTLQQHQCSADNLKKAKHYNKVFGTHLIAPRYTFEPNKPPVIEGANRLLEVGCTCFKFDMQSHPEPKNPMASEKVPPGVHTLLQNVQDPTLPNQAVFDEPFGTFMFWLRGGGDYFRESKELATYLMKRYKGSGKTFMLGTWKTDYLIRDWTGVGTPLRPHPNATTPILQERVTRRTAAWEAQQAGVDAARNELAADTTGVQVYSYLEINLVRNTTVNFSVIEDVVPTMNPVPDFISVSLSTLPQYIMSPNPVVVSRMLHPLLDLVASKLPYKAGIPGPRVFIGEFEFPLRNQYGQTGADTWTTPTQELQAKHALATVAAAIAWGTPWTMWWEMYDNTKTFTLNGTEKEQLGTYEDRGFGLVSKDNRDSALYRAVKQYMTQANEWLCQQVQVKNGALPCRNDFRQWAVKTLVDISNSIDAGTGRTNYTAPAVVNRSCA